MDRSLVRHILSGQFLNAWVKSSNSFFTIIKLYLEGCKVFIFKAIGWTINFIWLSQILSLFPAPPFLGTCTFSRSLSHYLFKSWSYYLQIPWFLLTFDILAYSWDTSQILKPIGHDSSCAEEKYCKDGMQLPNLGRQRGFWRADLTVFSISSWNLAQFPSNFLHIFKVSSAFHCILHLNIRFIPSAMHKRRGKLSKKLFWAPKYTLSQITQEALLVILWGFLWILRALLLMYSN